MDWIHQAYDRNHLWWALVNMVMKFRGSKYGEEGLNLLSDYLHLRYSASWSLKSLQMRIRIYSI
jgi:hypothetical protein